MNNATSLIRLNLKISYLFLTLIFMAVFVCEGCTRKTKPLGDTVRVDLYKTYAGCDLNYDKTELIFKHPQKMCAVDPEYQTLHVPVAYVQSCYKYKPTKFSGSLGDYEDLDHFIITVSYPDFKPLEPYIRLTGLENNIIHIDVIAEPCDAFNQRDYVRNYSTFSSLVSKKINNDSVYTEKSLGNNWYEYKNKFRFYSISQIYLYKDNQGKILNAYGCDEIDRCGGEGTSPLNEYRYTYTFKKGIGDYLKLDREVRNFVDQFYISKEGN